MKLVYRQFELGIWHSRGKTSRCRGSRALLCSNDGRVRQLKVACLDLKAHYVGSADESGPTPTQQIPFSQIEDDTIDPDSCIKVRNIARQACHSAAD